MWAFSNCWIPFFKSVFPSALHKEAIIVFCSVAVVTYSFMLIHLIYAYFYSKYTSVYGQTASVLDLQMNEDDKPVNRSEYNCSELSYHHLWFLNTFHWTIHDLFILCRTVSLIIVIRLSKNKRFYLLQKNFSFHSLIKSDKPYIIKLKKRSIKIIWH